MTRMLNKTIKEYEYLLNDKQSKLNNYIKYLETACDLLKWTRSRLLKYGEIKRLNLLLIC
jgi:hypothetical protein